MYEMAACSERTAHCLGQHKHIGGAPAVHGYIVGYSNRLQDGCHFKAVDRLGIALAHLSRQPAYGIGIGRSLVGGFYHGLREHGHSRRLPQLGKAAECARQRHGTGALHQARACSRTKPCALRGART